MPTDDDYDKGVLVLRWDVILLQGGKGEPVADLIIEGELGPVRYPQGPIPIRWDEQRGLPVPTPDALLALDQLVRTLLDDGWEFDWPENPLLVEDLFDWLIKQPVQIRRLQQAHPSAQTSVSSAHSASSPRPTPTASPSQLSQSTSSITQAKSAVLASATLVPLSQPAVQSTPSRSCSASLIGRMVVTGTVILGVIWLGNTLKIAFTDQAPTKSTPFATPKAAMAPTNLPSMNSPTPMPSLSSVALAIPGTGSHTFPETGKTANGIFLSFWETNGGVVQLGYPISDLLRERSEIDGREYTVQYFERAMLEYHPENSVSYQVLPAQLGYLRYKAKYPSGAPNEVTDPVNPIYFAETQHSVGGAIARFWSERGGVAQLGYPISGEFTEQSELNSKLYTVQYFQRAVIELHPEGPPPFDVQLAQLGRFRYQQKYGH